MTRLPETLDQLRGLVADLAVRESTKAQGRAYGPAAQRALLTATIEELDLVPGIERIVLKSGWSGHTGDKDVPALTTDEYRELVESDSPVLLFAFCSRAMRDPRQGLNLIAELHRRGRVVLFADAKLLSSNGEHYGRIQQKLAAAWEESSEKSRLIRGGYAAKREAGLPGGRPFRGYIGAKWDTDPTWAPIVTKVWTSYAAGNGSMRAIAAQEGLNDSTVREMLACEAYARTDAPWEPLVDKRIYEQVSRRRETNHRAGGTSRHPNPLPNLVHSCGTLLRRDGAGKTGTRRLHPNHLSCPSYGPHARHNESRWLEPIKTYLRARTVTEEALSEVSRRLESRDVATIVPARVPSPRGALQRLTAAYMAGTLSDEDYTTAVKDLKRAQELPDVGNIQSSRRSDDSTSPELAITFLRNLDESLALIDEYLPDQAPKAWADLSQAVISKVVDHGDTLEVSFTDEARSALVGTVLPVTLALHGQRSDVGATGFEPATS